MKRSIIKVVTLKPTSRPRAKRPSWYHPAFGFAAVLTLLPATNLHAQTISQNQTPSEQAQPADSFVDSIGISTPALFNFGMNNVNGVGTTGASTRSYYNDVKQAILSLGIRHLRYGPPDAQTASDLYQNNLLCLFKADLSDYGYNLQGTYSTIADSRNPYSILTRIKADSSDIEGIEGPNEPDLFWPNQNLSYSTPSYGQAVSSSLPQPVYFMQDLFHALKSDPSTASLPIVGPSLQGSPDPYNPNNPYPGSLQYSTITDYYLGNAAGKDPNPNPWAIAGLSSYVNYGNMHSYPTKDYASQGGTYDGINNYLQDCNQPSAVIDTDDVKEYSPNYKGMYLNNILVTTDTFDDSWAGTPLDFAADQVAYTDSTDHKLPMCVTETGYQSDLFGNQINPNTGNSLRHISYKVQAKYIPRLLAEYFRTNTQTMPGTGIARTYLFSLADDPQQNFGDDHWGLLEQYFAAPTPTQVSLKPKPAYTALQSLIGLLKEPGKTNFPTGTLTYRIDVSPTTGLDQLGNTIKYDRTWYVHHLLLQKSNGDYYLVLWHEISDDDATAWDSDHTKPFTEIQPPPMPTTVTLPASIGSVTEFDYDGNWNLQPKPLTISGGQVSVNVPDQIMVLRLTPAAAEAAFNGPHTISPTATTTVQAEDYDIGGYGTAYTAYFQPGASFSAYRPDDLVGIGSTYKAGPLGYYVGWMAQGQFLNYTVTVPEAGNYLLAFRYASGDTSNGNNFSVLDQATGQTTNPIPVSYSGVNGSYPWDTWANTAPVEMALNYGPQTLRLNENTGGYNLDNMTFTRDMNSYPFSVPGGFPIANTGSSTVRTSDFDLGGQDVAYNNTYIDPGNYSPYRPNDQVGLWRSVDTGGGYEVAWTAPGQWLKYTVNVAAPGTYAVTFRVASASSTNTVAGSFHLQDANSNNLTGPVTFNGTGGWDNWATTSPVNVTFTTAGTQTVTLFEDSANFNVNSMTFTYAGVNGTAFSSGGAATSGTAPKLGGAQLAAATSAPIPAQNAFDGSLSTYFASAAGAGYVGIDAGAAVPVTQITYAPRPGYESRMVGGVFEGSNTSSNAGYTTLASVTATPKDGLVNVVKVAGGKPYRYLRFRSAASGYCTVAEVKFQN